MGARGRKSGASLAVVGPGGLETIRRPEPPAELTDEQADEWQAVVNSLPADWCPRWSWSVLAQHCRHVVAARRVAQLIAALEARDDFDTEEYDRLLRMQERESRAVTATARTMRITQQATYDPKRKKPKATKRPWEED